MPTDETIDIDITEQETGDQNQYGLNGYQGQISAREQPLGYFEGGTDFMALIQQDYRNQTQSNHSICLIRLGISTAQNGCVVEIGNGGNSPVSQIILGDTRVPNPTHLYQIHSPDSDAIRIKVFRLPPNIYDPQTHEIIDCHDSSSDMIIEYIASRDIYD